MANYYATTKDVVEGLKSSGGTGGAMADVLLSPLFGLALIIVGFFSVYQRRKARQSPSGGDPSTIGPVSISPVISPVIQVNPVVTTHASSSAVPSSAGSTGAWLSQQAPKARDKYLASVKPELSMTFTGGRELSVEIHTTGVSSVTVSVRVRSDQFKVRKWIRRDQYWVCGASHSLDLISKRVDGYRISYALHGLGANIEEVATGDGPYGGLKVMELDVRCECQPAIEPVPTQSITLHL